MEVAISALRAELSTWIQRARNGEEIVVTDRGVPVVRLVGVESSTLIEDLTRRGVLNAPAVTSRHDPRDLPRPVPRRPVSDLIGEHRDR